MHFRNRDNEQSYSGTKSITRDGVSLLLEKDKLDK